MKATNERINEAASIRAVKERMHFLKQYTASLRLHSILYAQDGEGLQVEDNLVDYLHYTRSMLRATEKQGYYEKGNAVLNAMELQARDKRKAAQKDRQAYILLEAIKQLKGLERDLLLDIYVKQVDKEIILRHQGNIVESTFHRRLRKACLHLAFLLQIEVMHHENTEV